MLENIICSSIAGTLSRVPCHPLDTCKTVSAAHEGRRLSLPAVVRLIYQREGIRGFYRGVGIAGLGAAPGVGLYISVYEALKASCDERLDPKYAAATHLVSGFAAEAVSCAVWLPIDVVKERLQTQGPEVAHRYANSWEGLRRVAALEGLGGLYKGYWLTLASFGPYSAFYFASFEQFKWSLFGIDATKTPEGHQAFVCGAAANVVACTLTQPLDVVKTRYQIQRAALVQGGAHFDQYGYAYRGMWDGVVTIAKTDGFLGLWRGLVSRIVFTAPNAAISFALYATFKQRWFSHTV